MNESVKKTSKGRKVLTVLGTIFIGIGVFLGAFTLSVQVMIHAANSAQTDENVIQNENKKLKENVQLLQDQLDLMESDLERYRDEDTPKVTPSPTRNPSSTQTNAPSSTVKPSSSSSTAKPSSTSGQSSRSTKKSSSSTATKKPTQNSTSGSSSVSATKKPASTSNSSSSSSGSSSGSSNSGSTGILID